MDTYEEQVEYFDTMLNEAGVLYSGGPDKQQNADIICKVVGEDSIDCKMQRFELPWDMEARLSMASYLFFFQVALYDELMKPIHPDDYISGNFTEEFISLSTLNKVPITLFMMENDTTCPPDKNIRIQREATSEVIDFYQGKYDHGYFCWIQGDTYLSKIVASIETGDPNNSQEFRTHAYSFKDNLFWNQFDHTSSLDTFIQ
jgi:hypothetical protein